MTPGVQIVFGTQTYNPDLLDYSLIVKHFYHVDQKEKHPHFASGLESRTFLKDIKCKHCHAMQKTTFGGFRTLPCFFLIICKGKQLWAFYLLPWLV